MAKADKPNILVIWGDDIGIWSLSCYHRGAMGGRTPNIDRIAAEGAIFTDYYGQQSCTAGRAAFITGQHPFRTGLLKVGLPGAELGLRPEDPTIADLLKNHGYATGQFGKNHLGDRNEYLPTVHGFLSRLYMVGAAAVIVEDFLKTFREYPPRQRAATFTIDQALEKMKAALGGGGR
jgi:arylsulfatase